MSFLESKSVEDIISILNDNIDPYYFPVSKIASVDDEEMWDRIANHIGGYSLSQLLKGGIPKTAKWFVVDTEQNFIRWYDTKEEIIKDFEDLSLEDVYGSEEENEDNSL